MALTAAGLLELAHESVAGVGGIGVTATFEDSATATAVILSEAEPVADAGPGEGYTDTRRMIRLAVLTKNRATAPLADELILLPSPYDGIEWHVAADSIELTQGEHRFTVVEGPVTA